jgi:2-polyprenyl-3-methyl-5-hydroxy-6-metoxy-1,4-benzoquinol methylase
MSKLPKENIYGHTKKLKFILEQVNNHLIQLGKPITLLDFGCGNGTAVSQFLMRDGIRFYGVDFHEPSLEYARKHFAAEHVYFSDHIPAGIQFDIIVYADVLEHVPDPASLLRQHHTLLNEHGIIVGAVPNGFGPFEMEKRISKYLGLTAAFLLAQKIARMLFGPRSNDQIILPYNEDSGHIQFFTKKTFIHTLHQSGFKISNFKKGAFLGAPLSESFFLRGEKIAKMNAQVANYLPYWAVSTWYFTANKLSE